MPQSFFFFIFFRRESENGMLTSLKYEFYTFNHIIKISLSKDASWIYMDFCDKDRGDVNLICLGI